jgi:hypothetical protein
MAFGIDHGFVPLPGDPPHVVSALVVRDGVTMPHCQRFNDFCEANETIVGKKVFASGVNGGWWVRLA